MSREAFCRECPLNRESPQTEKSSLTSEKLPEVRHDDLRPGGYVSGPALFDAADAALWFLASARRDTPQPMALTSDLAIRYLSPAVGQRIRARADLNKGGARTLIGSVSVWMDDNESQPCAIAQDAYILPA